MHGVNRWGQSNSVSFATPPGPGPKTIRSTLGSSGSGPGGPVFVEIEPPSGGIVFVAEGFTSVCSLAELLSGFGSGSDADALAESLAFVGSPTSGARTTMSTVADVPAPRNPMLQ